MTTGERNELIPVESLDEIPAFTSEDEEAEFWSTHSFGEALLEQMGPLDDVLPPARRRRRRRLRVTMHTHEFSREVPAQHARRDRATYPDFSPRTWLVAS